MNRGIIKILGKDATSFAACFYNEKKVAQGKAEQPVMINLGDLQKYKIHSPVVLSRYLQKIADQNPNVVHPQLHLMGTLPGNPSENEKKQFINQLIKVLGKLGYGNQPILIYAHNDTKNWHVHLVSVRVDQQTGRWINDWQEGRRARHELDKLRGVTAKNEIEKFLDYKFESKEQFLNLLKENGYRKSYYDEELDVVNVIRAGELKHIFTMDEIQQRIDATGRNKDKEKNRIKELRGILRDRRQRSMNYLVDNPDIKITKDGKRHTVSEKLRDVRGAAFEGHEGLDIKGIRKAQFKQFLGELKNQMGIAVVFNQWKDGSTKGYTLIDYKNKTVFKGSDILALDELLNPNWRKGQEKDQVLTADEAFESTQQLMESPSLASDIYEELTNLGLDIHEPSENEMTDIAINFSDDEHEQREEAVRIFMKLLREHPEPMSENDNGYNDVREEGQKAYNHAATAEWLRRLEQEREEKEQTKATDIADDELSMREKLAWDEVGDYILDYFEDNNIEYNYNPVFKVEIKGMDEQKARQLAFEKFEEAIYAHDNGWENAADIAWEALAYVQVMERLHEDPELLKRHSKQQTVLEDSTLRQHDSTDISVGKKERKQAISDALSDMNEYGDRKDRIFTDDEMLEISKGIVARSIENGWNSFNMVNLEKSLKEFRDEVNLMPFTKDLVEVDTRRDILGVYVAGLLASLQQSGGGGISNNNLPKNKDDQWNIWKALFGMRPPRRSAGQSVKR